MLRPTRTYARGERTLNRIAATSLLAVVLCCTTGCSLNDLLKLAGVDTSANCTADDTHVVSANVGGSAFDDCTVSVSGAPEDSFVLSANSADVVPSTLTITLSGAGEPGEYKLGGETADGDDNGVFIKGDELLGDDGAEAATYKTSQEVESGSVTLTEVTAEKLVGTFTFTATNMVDDTKTLEITDGAFDVAF